MDFIMAVALLCGNPSANRLYSNEVLECQQYYIKCVAASSKQYLLGADLAKCILEKKELGGSK